MALNMDKIFAQTCQASRSRRHFVLNICGAFSDCCILHFREVVKRLTDCLLSLKSVFREKMRIRWEASLSSYLFHCSSPAEFTIDWFTTVEHALVPVLQLWSSLRSSALLSAVGARLRIYIRQNGYPLCRLFCKTTMCPFDFYCKYKVSHIKGVLLLESSFIATLNSMV